MVVVQTQLGSRISRGFFFGFGSVIDLLESHVSRLLMQTCWGWFRRSGTARLGSLPALNEGIDCQILMTVVT